ncbi:MAG: outer membrane protein assembly factor BamA, partial [Bdellovibrionales bacterium]|nr:outer membrane protein assembly factor BamA [Bdellovibrionales bacterium]
MGDSRANPIRANPILLRALSLILGLLVLAGPASAVEAAPRRRAPLKKTPVAALPREVVQQIQVRGNAKVDTDAILEKIKSTVGKELNHAQVREDILALHKLNFFDEVEVRFEAGVLIYQVKERPTIARIVFFGNEEMEADDLKGVLSIKTFDLFDENLVRESARKLERHYEEKGFYLARVSHEVRKGRDADSVEVLFRVREYDKVKIRKITFLGNKAFTDDQLKRILRSTQEGGFFSALSGSGNFKELDFKTDLQILQYWYLNEGYVRFRTETPVVTVTEDKKWIHITIKVDEGRQYAVADTDFSGDLLFP